MAKTVQVEKIQVIPVEDGVWAVPSTSESGVTYEVRFDGTQLRCNCPAGWNGRDCKHRRAVIEVEKMKEQGKDNKVEKEPKSSKTKLGYEFDEVASALQKEVRRGDEEAALWWGMELYEVAYYYFWKRILIMAAEDVGMAAPEVVQQVILLAVAWKMCKDTSYYVDPQHAVMAILLLARAPKGTEVDDAKNLMLERRRAGRKIEVPEYARDAHTKSGKAMKKDVADWYRDRNKVIPTNPYREKLVIEFPDNFQERLI